MIWRELTTERQPEMAPLMFNVLRRIILKDRGTTD
jgi:hypothetical protein